MARALAADFWLLRHQPAGELSLISLVTPVLATLLGVAVGDGKIDAATIVGTGLVIAGLPGGAEPTGTQPNAATCFEAVTNGFSFRSTAIALRFAGS
ncbi:MAG: hypothetical protein IPK26_12335 [Planctomycetes bacterium]|nr:hypothetical protein [Planctomycetota bacterium]